MKLFSRILIAFILCASASCSKDWSEIPVAEGGVIHRFFDTCPVSPSGKYIALFRLPYEGKTPLPGDEGEVIVINLRNGKEVYSAKTRGWEVQMGANVQWGADDHSLIYNDVDTTTWQAYAVVDDFLNKCRTRLPGTVFMVSPDGGKLASYDLLKSRYAQPGYGVIVPDEKAVRNVGPVSDDGVFVTDIASGKCEMIASIRDIYEKTVPSIKIDNPEDYEYYCFQVKWNPQGTKLLTTVQWTPRTGGSRIRSVISMNPDGTDIRTAVTPEQWSHGGHHINWMPDGVHMSMNLNLDGKKGLEIYTFRYDGTELTKVYEPGSGHPSAHPGGLPFFLTDAYAGEMNLSNGNSPIRLIDIENQTESIIAESALPRWGKNTEYRIDAHPVWGRDGNSVIFNGSKDGHRCVFIKKIAINN